MWFSSPADMALGFFVRAPDLRRKPVVVVGRDARISGPWVRDIVCGTFECPRHRRDRFGAGTTLTAERWPCRGWRPMEG